MDTFDFSKAVNFKPLEEIGVSSPDGAKFLAALSPMIDLEFQQKIKSAFTDDEMAKIGEEAEGKGIKPEDGMFFLEEKYHEKTGNYFMEEMRILFDAYVVHAANILTQARKDTEDFANSGSENVQKFDELMKSENWEDAAKLLDETLKNKTSN